MKITKWLNDNTWSWDILVNYSTRVARVLVLDHLPPPLLSVFQHLCQSWQGWRVGLPVCLGKHQFDSPCLRSQWHRSIPPGKALKINRLPTYYWPLVKLRCGWHEVCYLSGHQHVFCPARPQGSDTGTAPWLAFERLSACCPAVSLSLQGLTYLSFKDRWQYRFNKVEWLKITRHQTNIKSCIRTVGMVCWA